jgi:hypothetical protein
MSDEVQRKGSVPPTSAKIPPLSSALPSEFDKLDEPTLPPRPSRLEAASFALTLGVIDHRGVLSKAFDNLALDPGDPLQWRFLIEHLVRVVDLPPPPQTKYAAQFERFLDASPIRPAGAQTSISGLREAPKLTAERVLRLNFATTLAPNDKGPLSKAFREQKLNPERPTASSWRCLIGSRPNRRTSTPPQPTKSDLLPTQQNSSSGTGSRTWIAHRDCPT